MISILLLTITLLGPVGIEWSAVPSAQIAVECAGDVNGDGTEDCFSISSEVNNSGVFCLDGLTGEIIWQSDFISGARNTDCFRTIGDVNSDGISDVAAGTASPSLVTVFSGADGTVIWSSFQAHKADYLAVSNGPNPGDVVVLVLGNNGSDMCNFCGLNGLTGDTVWIDPYATSTLDNWLKVTDVDINGNGWSEMGFSIDRGSVMSGGASIRDGYTGEYIYGTGACYFPTMDISDSPIPCIAVSHFGWEPDIWMENVLVGFEVWSHAEANFNDANLTFIPNITGPGSPYPELLAWGSNELTLILGNQGNYQDSYEFPANLIAVDCFSDTQDWKLVALVSTKLYCPTLTYSNPQIEPFVPLPSSAAKDMCLLESDQFPTPLVCVAMNGASPGVCAIRTSWQVQLEENADVSISIEPSIRITSSPGIGGIGVFCEKSCDISVVDITGRCVNDISLDEGTELFIQTPPGVYFLMEKGKDFLVQRAVVVN